MKGGSMSLPCHRLATCLGKAALKTHALQTLRDCPASPNRAKRLECVRFIGAFRRARDGPRFMDPKHGRKAEGAFHEPQDASLANEQVAHLGFMVPMHGKNGEGALHEPQGRAGVSPA